MTNGIRADSGGVQVKEADSTNVEDLKRSSSFAGNRWNQELVQFCRGNLVNGEESRRMSILQEMGFANFNEFEESLFEESSKAEQRFVKWGKDLFKAKDALRALVKEGISDRNRDEACRLAKEVDLFDAELKELKIRWNLIREKWKWLTLEKNHFIALNHKEKAAECDDKKE